MIFTIFFLLFIFENYVNVPSKSNMQKNFFTIKLVFCWRLKGLKIAGSVSESGSISQRRGSATLVVWLVQFVLNSHTNESFVYDIL